MSPTEFDLRAALHDGEGHGPDPDSVLAAGRARASARRSRLAAVTGAVVAVLAVGTTGAILLSRDDHGPESAASRRGATAPTSALQAPADGDASGNAAAAPSSVSASRTATGSSPAANAAGTAAGVKCPSTFATRQLPGGGGSGQFGSGGPLFRGAVTSVVACGYGSTGSADTMSPGRLVLTGSDAARLAASLDNAPTTRSAIACPDFRVADDHRLVFIAITSAGASTPVSTTLGNPSCSVQVTNGTSVRYNWSPPADLKVKLFAITPK